MSEKSVREELEALAREVDETRTWPTLRLFAVGRYAILARRLRALASRLPAAEAPDAPPPASLLETAGNSLRWLLHLHHGVSLGGEDTPITGAEWRAALGSARSALAAIENYKPPPGNA